MILLYISAIILATLLTFFIRKYAIKKKIIDTPNSRSSHSIPTPRGGGLAIVITWYIGIIILYYIEAVEKDLFFAFASGLILAIISLLDDLFNLNPKIRLLAQALTAFGAIYFLGGFNIEGNNSEFISIITTIFTLIAIIWFINLFNFLDGLDGYASQEAILVGIAMFIATKEPIIVIIITSVSGFLIWNWPKAKIFMGDVGSTQLGFILIVFGLYFHNNETLSVLQWLGITSLFWFDASVTLIRRILLKEQISVAHKKHAYQRLHQSGFSHLKVLLSAITFNVIIIILFGVFDYFNIPHWLFLLTVILFNCIIYFLIIEKRKTFPRDM